jgi:hypothetical protein
MLRFTTLVAISIVAAHPALAAAPVEHGEADGQRFEYTTVLQANGVIHFAGLVLGSNEHFVLDVTRNGHVGGSFGDVPVEYHIDKGVRDKLAAELGEGPAMAEATQRK